MSFDTVKGRIFIVAMDDLSRLELQFFPESIPVSRTATINNVGIIGGNQPKYHHTGGETQLTLKMSFATDKNNAAVIMQRIKWLESLTYNSDIAGPPPTVKIVWGKFFRDDLWVIKSVAPDFSLFDTGRDLLPRLVFVSVNFLQTATGNINRRDVLWT